ncbi:hypothetical protein FRUB_01589 [Fimbriiglobus ruber]|uniref:Uncharacterized protein n=1 Tax=Fimbriiglobus ruber TaxID=1908690 RepID=A0A225E389_9BACT|nr:hypothetical protein FRUB_01589 [Fimbriiglobus ruber]
MLCCGPLGAADEPGKNKEDEARREEQHKNLKRSAAQYVMFPADNRKRPFKFREDAVLRFSNPVTGCKDGAVYLWVDGGRPRALLKVYTYDNEHFSHELQSLAEGAIVAERDGKSSWNPTNPGVAFRELVDAPGVAQSAAERLRQMKAMAGKFSATYVDGPPGTTPLDLRLLIQPVFRFETGHDQRGPDGAMFAFASGTNPMAILMLEARQVGESWKWHYAFARTASGAVTARYGEKEIFSVDRYDFRNNDPTQTFLLLPRQSLPKE